MRSAGTSNQMYQNFQIQPKINMTDIGDVVVIKARKPIGSATAIIAPRAISATVTTAQTMPWVNAVVITAAIHEARPNKLKNWPME